MNLLSTLILLLSLWLPPAAVGPLPDTCTATARADACPLTTDAVNGPFAFAADDAASEQWHRLDIAPTGLLTTLTIRPTSGLELRATVVRDTATLTTLTTPVLTTTLDAAITGTVLVRIERLRPTVEDAAYTIEVRQQLPPPPAAPAPDAPAPTVMPDDLENNWTFATASDIGIGVVYDLTFACPVVNGCAGGDHDYLRVPVKRGGKYLFATFDLGPGVDTVLDLYWGGEVQPIAANDDAGPGGFASLLRWVAPTDGYAVIRVGPRSGGTTAQVDSAKAGTYRFAVALQGTDLAADLTARVQAQTQTAPAMPTASPTARPAAAAPNPPPTPAPTAPSAPPAATPVPTATAPVSDTTTPDGTSAGTAISDASVGPGIVVVPLTDMRVDPTDSAEVLQTLPAETIVTLSGKGKGVWVRVTTADGVMPGWIRAQHLRRLTDATAPAPGAALGSSPVLTTTGTLTPTQATFTVRAIDPLPPTTQAASAAREPRSVTVLVYDTASAPRATPRSGSQRTPLPASLPNIRVQLVTALGDVVAEAQTTTGGVTLTRDVDADTVLFVQLPASGLRVPVPTVAPTAPDAALPPVLITLPGGIQ